MIKIKQHRHASSIERTVLLPEIIKAFVEMLNIYPFVNYFVGCETISLHKVVAKRLNDALASRLNNKYTFPKNFLFFKVKPLSLLG